MNKTAVALLVFVAGLLMAATAAASTPAPSRFDIPAMDREAAVLPPSPTVALPTPAPHTAPKVTPKVTVVLRPTQRHSIPPAATRAVHTWGYGCDAARAYWRLHGNPRFTFICTGDTGARPQAFTCPTACSNGPSWTVQINDPCPTAYMNEASNSWTWDRYNGGLGWYSYEVQQRQNEPWSVLHAHGLDPDGYSC